MEQVLRVEPEQVVEVEEPPPPPPVSLTVVGVDEHKAPVRVLYLLVPIQPGVVFCVVVHG